MASESASDHRILQRLAALRGHPLISLGLRVASRGLVAASALFLAVVALRYWDELSAIALEPGEWLAIGGLALAYGLALLLLGLAWHRVLLLVGAGPVGLSHSMRAHTGAQLAKYVPGNVFHFVGRHMIHRAAGMDDRRLALAALVENILLLLAAACVATACLAAFGQGIVRQGAFALGAVLAAGLPLLGRLLLSGLGWPARAAAAAFALAVAFFAIMALMIGALAAMLGAGHAGALAGGGVGAWIAGFLTPGAPGGLGVREAVMLLTGRGVAPEKALVLALLFRVVTFAGDIVCAAIGRHAFRG